MIRALLYLLILSVPCLGAVQYSGAVPTVATGVPATRTALVDLIEGALDTAGWSCTGSTGDWYCTTASDANATGQVKVRIFDPGSGNCARLTMSNTTDTIQLTTIPAYILPDGVSTWTVIANKFHFYAYSDGNHEARHAVHAGTLYKPSFLTGLTTFGYYAADGYDDTDTSTGRDTFRDALATNQAVHGVILNSDSWTANNPYQYSSGAVGLIWTMCCGNENMSQAKQWADDSYMILDPLVKSDGASNAGDDEGKIIGLLWDCLVVAWRQFNEGDLITYDGKTWRAITHLGVYGGTLFHYVPTP